LDQLQPPGRRVILELGCGTGDVTLGLLGRADRIDAVEPSSAMLSVARGRPGADDAAIRWISSTAETAVFDGPYSLAIAAESLHWMEWGVVLPKVAAALAPGALLAVAERGIFGPLPWDVEMGRLVAKYSTNREYRPYDLVGELTSRALFREVGRQTTLPVAFAQSIEDHVLSLHSRNGFSRDRMGHDSAREFDTRVRRLLERHCPDQTVRLETVASIVWGVPDGNPTTAGFERG
jgi:SAM-dependent methyltransferase